MEPKNLNCKKLEKLVGYNNNNDNDFDENEIGFGILSKLNKDDKFRNDIINLSPICLYQYFKRIFYNINYLNHFNINSKYNNISKYDGIGTFIFNSMIYEEYRIDYDNELYNLFKKMDDIHFIEMIKNNNNSNNNSDNIKKYFYNFLSNDKIVDTTYKKVNENVYYTDIINYTYPYFMTSKQFFNYLLCYEEHINWEKKLHEWINVNQSTFDPYLIDKINDKTNINININRDSGSDRDSVRVLLSFLKKNQN